MQHPVACGLGGYQEHPLERVMRGLAAAGFHYVEVTAIPSPHSRIVPEQMDAHDWARLAGLLDDHGLKPVSVSGHADLTTEQGVEQLRARIDCAVRLGVDIVNTGAGHAESPEEAQRFFRHMREQVLPYAAARGVRIALETHGGLTGTAEDCLRTLDALDSEWVGINYDPANVLYYRGVRPETDIQQIAGRVIHVHMKDQRGGQGVLDFPPLGEGTVDFAGLLRTLGAAGYRGPFSAEIELHRPPSPEEEDRIRLHTRQYMEKLLAAWAASSHPTR
jgi:sugar phosphate isomerase/epimerase